MNQNELSCFRKDELQYPDITELPPGLIVKSLLIKLRRKTWGRLVDRGSRFVWTMSAVNDVTGPAENVRNYRERAALRSVLSSIAKEHPIKNACEVGCGYGRLTMVLDEFAEKAVGFERESHLVDIARSLVPEVDFRNIDSLDRISATCADRFDFAMTCTVLQHLTDGFCKSVLDDMRRLVPSGHVLLIEKTEDISTTKNVLDGSAFLSRARSLETYAQWMAPFELVSVTKRVVESTYFNPNPGACMLFRAPRG